MSAWRRRWECGCATCYRTSEEGSWAHQASRWWTAAAAKAAGRPRPRCEGLSWGNRPHFGADQPRRPQPRRPVGDDEQLKGRPQSGRRQSKGGASASVHACPRGSGLATRGPIAGWGCWRSWRPAGDETLIARGPSCSSRARVSMSIQSVTGRFRTRRMRPRRWPRGRSAQRCPSPSRRRRPGAERGGLRGSRTVPTHPDGPRRKVWRLIAVAQFRAGMRWTAVGRVGPGADYESVALPLSYPGSRR